MSSGRLSGPGFRAGVLGVALGCAAIAVAATAYAQPESSSTPASPSAPLTSSPTGAGADWGSPDDGTLGTVVVTAPEPRYVAPTRVDRIGRIWAPVYLNGQGPFRLVLDSGASSSEITARVATSLGLKPDTDRTVLLRGVVGSVQVPTVRIRSFTVGDLSLGRLRMPIVPDALGGADGILGTDRMEGRRLFIDFNHDRITIARSHDTPAPPGYLTIPFVLKDKELLVAEAWIGDVRADAIIDTGGQVTIGNLALQKALQGNRAPVAELHETIEDVTRASQEGHSAAAPPILLGTGFRDSTVQIANDRLTYGDMHIFEHWQMTKSPAMLVGMDVLGRLGVLVIDYRRHELQIALGN